jgi:hypothetical protein
MLNLGYVANEENTAGVFGIWSEYLIRTWHSSLRAAVFVFVF